MTMRDHEALTRIAALMQTEQARAMADESDVRRLAAQIDRLSEAPRVRQRRWLLGMVMTAVPALVVAFVWWPRPLSYQAAGVATREGMKLATDEVRSLPLRFSDGSVLTIAPDSQAEVAELSSHGASVRLETGMLTAAVVHADRTRWTVGAGPYVVNVTGTKFTAAWDKHRRRLRVVLTEGSVVVLGPMLGATGLPLKQGQALVVDVEGGKVSLSPMSEPTEQDRPADGASLAAPTLAIAPPPAERPVPRGNDDAATEANSWKRWALAAKPREALAAAKRVGLGDLSRALPVSDLLLLADAARFASDATAAASVFSAVRERFPDDVRAGDAVFGLGVLAIDADQRPALAARYFEEYLASWPAGPLAREAQGRLMEALERAHRVDDAVRVAISYLARFSQGPHAGLARRLLTTKR
jgi:hypothetical protein